jgi:hypothetical protein
MPCVRGLLARRAIIIRLSDDFNLSGKSNFVNDFA